MESASIVARPVRTPKPVVFHDHNTDVLFAVMKIVPAVRESSDTWLAHFAAEEAVPARGTGNDLDGPAGGVAPLSDCGLY